MSEQKNGKGLPPTTIGRIRVKETSVYLVLTLRAWGSFMKLKCRGHIVPALEKVMNQPKNTFFFSKFLHNINDYYYPVILI